MTELAFAPPAITTLPVVGEEAMFPVRRVYCIGRNYGDHAIEMGHDPNKESPFFFPEECPKRRHFRKISLSTSNQ